MNGCTQDLRTHTATMSLNECVPVNIASFLGGSSVLVFSRLVSINCFTSNAGGAVTYAQLYRAPTPVGSACPPPLGPIFGMRTREILVPTSSGGAGGQSSCAQNITPGCQFPGCDPTPATVSIQALSVGTFSTQVGLFDAQPNPGRFSRGTCSGTRTATFTVSIGTPSGTGCFSNFGTSDSDTNSWAIRLYPAPTYVPIAIPPSSSPPNVGLILGSIGFTFGILACCGLVAGYYHVRAKLAALSPAAPRPSGPTDWATSRSAPWGMTQQPASAAQELSSATKASPTAAWATGAAGVPPPPSYPVPNPLAAVGGAAGSV